MSKKSKMTKKVRKGEFVPEKYLDSKGNKFFDPVFNYNTMRICEKYYCEGDYEDLPNFPKQYLNISDRPYDWEDLFIECCQYGDFYMDEELYEKQFKTLFFTEEGLKKLEIIFKEDLRDCKFIIDKIGESLDKFYEENDSDEVFDIPYPYCKSFSNKINYYEKEVMIMMSKHYMIFGNFLINMFTKYKCVNAFAHFIENKNSEDIFSYCFESWENFIMFGDFEMISILIKKQCYIVEQCLDKVIHRIKRDKIESNFNLYEIYKAFPKPPKIFDFKIINNLKDFKIIFHDFIKNFDKIRCEDGFHQLIYDLTCFGSFGFNEISTLLNEIIENDSNCSYYRFVSEKGATTQPMDDYLQLVKNINERIRKQNIV